MTNEEAYKWIYVHFAPCGDETKQDEAVNVALTALEKQIPKIPEYKEEDRFVKNFFAVYTYCPQCGYEINTGDMHCIQCGQAIDWMEEE